MSIFILVVRGHDIFETSAHFTVSRNLLVIWFGIEYFLTRIWWVVLVFARNSMSILTAIFKTHWHTLLCYSCNFNLRPVRPRWPLFLSYWNFYVICTCLSYSLLQFYQMIYYKVFLRCIIRSIQAVAVTFF